MIEFTNLPYELHKKRKKKHKNEKNSKKRKTQKIHKELQPQTTTRKEKDKRKKRTHLLVRILEKKTTETAETKQILQSFASPVFLKKVVKFPYSLSLFLSKPIR
jgi:Fe2+ transport system protein B